MLRATGHARMVIDADVASPNQVLTHAVRAAAKQLNKFQPPLVDARGARKGPWLEQDVAKCHGML